MKRVGEVKELMVSGKINKTNKLTRLAFVFTTNAFVFLHVLYVFFGNR